jgi:CheY-like chemotaxis protein/multidrug efflux pump subunit AcrA (membrane-fusion protein)
MGAATILLVDDDETLGRVLNRVLSQQGHTVVEAGNVARALEAAREAKPQLGLLDLRLPDGDGVELARKLTEQGNRFPLILMTAYPLRLRDQPELARQFARVLTKPLNLQELRQAIDGALALATTPTPPPAVPEMLASGLSAATAPLVLRESPPPTTADNPTGAPTAARQRRTVIVAVVLLALVGIAALPALGIVSIPGRHTPAGTNPAEKAAMSSLAASAVKDDPAGLILPEAVVTKLGLTTTVVQPGAGTRPLWLSGFINYDPDYMQRVHALFGGEVIDIAEVEENIRGTTERRKLSFNDRVHKKDPLAVVWSRDLGQLKSALVDALVRLQFDEDTLKRYQTLGSSGAISEVSLRTQQATVSLDRNTANSAENALRIARVPPEEIAAVKDEAVKIFERHGKHDPVVEENWARVEVRARLNGTIVEKNVVVGDTVDTSFDMFRIADLTKLTVWANAYEEDLRELNKLSLPFPWTVRLAADARPGGQAGTGPELNSPSFEKITPAIDPNQHTATLMGRVEPGQAQRGFVGRMVAVTIDLPQRGDTVAVPVTALDEDGETSVVFIQPDADKPYYSMRQVLVVQRLAEVVLVSSRLSEAERKIGLQEIKPGDRVVTRQTFLLRAALEDLKNPQEGQ